MKTKTFFVRLLATAALAMSSAASAIDVTFEIAMKDGRFRSEQAALERKDGAVTFRLARAAIPEGVKYVKLKPDFARAKVGDEGYWVNSDGELGTFKAREKDAVRVSKRPHMPFFGMKTPRGTWVAIVKGMSWNYSLAVELKNGYYTLAPTFEHHLAEAKEDIEVEFRWLKGDDADYSGMAKAYRAWQLARKEVVPLSERVKKQPLLDYMVKWPEVRVRLAWKPVPSPVPEQTVKDEPPVKPVITFDRFKRIVDEFKAQGVGGAEFCLVVWNVGGHDGRWPQIFPVEPLLGGEAKLKEAIAWAQTNGYYVVAHCNHRDAYIIADSWDAEYIVEKNPDGSLKRGRTTWGGGRMYTICPQRAYERFASKDMPMVAAMGFRGLHYLDVFSCVPPPFCDDPRHPVNERDGIKWVGHILQLGRDTFGGIASEGGYDQNAGQLDYVLYTSFSQPLDPSKYPALVDRYVPLFEIVYNGIILSNPFTTTVNAPIKGRPSELKTVEFAARPSFYFHANFLSTGRNWMGDTDLECFTDEQLVASVAAIKRGVDAYRDLARLQYRFIDRHAEAAPGVFLTQYDDGTKVYVNYNKEAASIDGTTIPAEDWRLVVTEKK